MLRDTLVEIGDMGERLSHIRDTLLVLQRAVPFVTEHGDGWMEADDQGAAEDGRQPTCSR